MGPVSNNTSFVPNWIHIPIKMTNRANTKNLRSVGYRKSHFNEQIIMF